MKYLKTSIGIELRGEDMLIAVLQSNLSSAVFTHFTRIAQYRALTMEELQREVNQFFKSNGLGKDNVVLGIPRKDIILRYLDFPMEVTNNLNQVVQYQVESFEPTDEDKFCYDYITLSSDEESKKVKILLAMVKKSLVEEYLQFLRGFGIRPAGAIAGSMGCANIFLQNQKYESNETFFLADLSSTGIELSALRNGTYEYSRETLREDNQSWKDAVLHEVDEAASKLRMGPDDTVEKIVLAGESSASALREIKAYLPDCELLEDSVGFTIPEENKPHFQEAACTVGLAFTGMGRVPIKMNLLPRELRSRQTRVPIWTAAALMLAIVALLFGLGFHRSVQDSRNVEVLNKEIAKNTAPVKEVQKVRNDTVALEEKIKSLEEILSKKDRNLEILRELTNILPMDAYLTSYANSYAKSDGAITLIGMADSASDLILKLEASPLFKDVKSQGSIIKDSATGKERFTIKANLER